jgi:MRG-binding protein
VWRSATLDTVWRGAPLPMAAQLADADADAFLRTAAGELALFRALVRARPVGLHKHFHVLAIRAAVLHDTGALVPPAAIWRALAAYFDLARIDLLVRARAPDRTCVLRRGAWQEPDGVPMHGRAPPPVADVVHWPTTASGLATFPYFVSEFALPADAATDALVAARRAASRPSSAEPARAVKRKRGAVRPSSESSDLTESGEDGESSAPPPTPAATVPAESEPEGSDEDEEESEREVSPGQCISMLRCSMPVLMICCSYAERPWPRWRPQGHKKGHPRSPRTRQGQRRQTTEAGMTVSIQRMCADQDRTKDDSTTLRMYSVLRKNG